MSQRQNGKGTLLTGKFWLKGGKVQDLNEGFFQGGCGGMVKKPSPSEPSLCGMNDPFRHSHELQVVDVRILIN